MNIEFEGEILTIVINKYMNGRVAVLLQDAQGMPFDHISANVVGYPMEEGEFAIKNYSGHQNLGQAIIDSGFFEATGKTVLTGYVELTILKLKEVMSPVKPPSLLA